MSSGHKLASVPRRSSPPRRPDARAVSSSPLLVTLGASAGGLEAIEAFLRHVPPDSGAAFVVIQHLDPTHAGALPELLGRSTPMPVLEVENGMRIDPDSLRQTRVVALSGYAQPEDRDHAREAGFDAHLAKPPSLEALEALLRSPASATS